MTKTIEKLLSTCILGASLASPLISIAGEAVFKDIPAWDEITADVCLVQNEDYKYTSFGQLFIQEDVFQAWKKDVGEKTISCLKEKQFMPKPLCDALFNVEDKKITESFLDDIYAANKSTLDNLDVLNSCQ